MCSVSHGQGGHPLNQLVWDRALRLGTRQDTWILPTKLEVALRPGMKGGKGRSTVEVAMLANTKGNTTGGGTRGGSAIRKPGAGEHKMRLLAKATGVSWDLEALDASGALGAYLELRREETLPVRAVSSCVRVCL